MAARSKRLIAGIAMLAFFVAGLIVMFMPIFEGQNALEYLDSLYNSISKGSAAYIPALEEEVSRYEGSPFEVTLAMKDTELALAAAALFDPFAVLLLPVLFAELVHQRVAAIEHQPDQRRDGHIAGNDQKRDVPAIHSRIRLV